MTDVPLNLSQPRSRQTPRFPVKMRSSSNAESVLSNKSHSQSIQSRRSRQNQNRNSYRFLQGFGMMSGMNKKQKEQMKQRKTLSKDGTMGAQPEVNDRPRFRASTKREVLISGGLEVKMDGLLWVKTSYSRSYRRKYVVFRNGKLRIYSEASFGDNSGRRDRGWTVTRSRAGSVGRKFGSGYRTRRDKRSGSVDASDEPEAIIDVIDLSNIVYKKRLGRSFELSVRKEVSVSSNANAGIKSNLLANQSRHESSEKKVSRNLRFTLSSAVRNIVGGERAKTFKFKSSQGHIADGWVQAILYELRNQASYVDDALKKLSVDQAKTYGVKISSLATDIGTMDSLYRQAVDLWALAKGKVSRETLFVLQQFIRFLQKENFSPEEILRWKEVEEKIEDMIKSRKDGSEGYISGLDELQALNDQIYHTMSNEYSFYVLPYEDSLDVKQRSSFSIQVTPTKSKKNGSLLGTPNRKVLQKKKSFNGRFPNLVLGRKSVSSDVEMDDAMTDHSDAEPDEQNQDELAINLLFSSARDVKKMKDKKNAQNEEKKAVALVRQVSETSGLKIADDLPTNNLVEHDVNDSNDI